MLAKSKYIIYENSGNMINPGKYQVGNKKYFIGKFEKKYILRKQIYNTGKFRQKSSVLSRDKQSAMGKRNK